LANLGQTLVDIDGERPLNPASNAKLLTMAAVLSELGPQWRFTTRLYGHVRGDTVERLVIWSNGDPTLDRSVLLDLAFQLVQRGIKHVGQLLVDQSFFDDKFVPPAFEQQPNEWATFRAPVSAVAFDSNTVSISVYPAQPDQPASVRTFPPSFTNVVNVSQTARSGSKSTIRVLTTAEGPKIKVNVSGSLASDAGPAMFWRRADDPRLLAGYALTDILGVLGVTVSNSVDLGAAEKDAVLAQHSSQELATLVQRLGKDSDNFVAEMLVKALGAHAMSRPGTSEDGMEVVRRFAEQVHPLEPGSRLINGSGLYDSNRLSAALLADVLRHLRRDRRWGPEFLASLAVAGRDGTLRTRLNKNVATSTVRGKTGTLNQVVSLSGYLDVDHATEPWVFSIIVNGIEKTDLVRQKIDEFVEKLIEAVPTQ
jgi:D-alanyl-D-alanine carboxypeptidase/D-alanyl-D-alanine-endopeptidase (penicillin-binding protein 4)